MIYPGAGSHSGAFLPGDYVVSVELPALRRVVVLAAAAPAGGCCPGPRSRGRGAFAIPFVDYARGDGAAIGAGHDLTWRLELIADDTPWVRDYRGLWGLDTHDPFGGERAPAGPRYERTRHAAAVVGGPAGLGGARRGARDARRGGAAPARRGSSRSGEELAGLDDEIDAERAAVRGLTAQARSLARRADTRALRRERVAERGAPGARRSRRCRRAAPALAEERAAHEAYLAGPRDPGPPGRAPAPPAPALRGGHGPAVALPAGLGGGEHAGAGPGARTGCWCGRRSRCSSGS